MVLNNIPIFYISFMKISAKVWKEVVRIQLSFHWGEASLGKKISCMKWSEVYKSEKDGGLGVKDLRGVQFMPPW